MMKKVLSFLAVLTILTGCYKITFVEQAHEVVKGDAFEGKIIVKRSGGSSNGTVQHVYGLFGLRVPKGWTSVGELVMTQVPKKTTDVGDEAYGQTITRRLLSNEAYTALLNRDYPREGYEWLGFVTDSDFKSLFNAEKAETEVDSIYATFTIQTTVDRTGVFYIDYVAGQISHDKLDGIGQQERDWVTRSATFSGDNISVVSLTDTRIRVTNADGSIDQSEVSEPVIDPAWELEAMPFSTTQGTAYAYRDLKYNRLFTRTRGWNGGDGVLTVGLPNGDVFWTFNDSFYGTVNAADRSRQSCSFPRNSVMVQRAHDGVLGETDKDLVWLADYVNWTNPSKDRYFHCRTHLRHPQGEKTLAEIHAGDIDQGKVYWSGDGVIYDGKLQMVWIGVESAELRNLGTALATYSLDGTVPTGRYLDTLPDYKPRQGDYLYMEGVTHGVNENVVSYGSTICDDASDGHLYLYGVNGFDVLVARTATMSLYSAWQYYVQKEEGQWTWQDAYPDEEAMKRSNIMASTDYGCHLPWVFRKGDWYYMTSQAPIFSTDVYIYRSRTPYGPFGDRRLLFRLPDHLDKIGPQKYHWLYMVNLHPALSRQGELVFSTNSDPDDFWWNFNDPGSADYYRPFFYRVFNWEQVYEDNVESKVQTSVKKPMGNSTYYNLSGLVVDKPHRGVYVTNGRKVVF